MGHPEVERLFHLLRPGCKPPNEKAIGGKFLDTVYESVVETNKELLKGKVVCMTVDGWINIRQHPIVSATVTDDDGSLYLIDTIDTTGSS